MDGEHPLSKGVFIDLVKTSYGIMEKTARRAVDTAIAEGIVLCGRLPNRRAGMEPQRTRSGRRVTLCHNRREEVNGPRWGERGQ